MPAINTVSQSNFDLSMPVGQRQAALNRLAVKVRMLALTPLNLNVYDTDCRHPVFLSALALMAERLVVRSEFDYDLAHSILQKNDAKNLSDDEMSLAVRAIWKSDRVGFYLGGNETFRNGFVAQLIEHWDIPSHRLHR